MPRKLFCLWLAFGAIGCDVLARVTSHEDAAPAAAAVGPATAPSGPPATPPPVASEAPPAASATPPVATPPVATPPVATPPVATPPAVLPRPKTIDDARQRLLEISKSGDLGRLAALVGADGRLEHAHRHERQRVRRTIGRAPDAKAVLEMFGEREPWTPAQYVSAFTSDPVDDRQLTAALGTSTVEYRPDGQFWIDFVFEKAGDELVLVKIATFDEEP